MSRFFEFCPGWFDFPDVYSWIAREIHDEDIFVELGVFLGRSTCYMMEELKNLNKHPKFYCVDLFKITPDSGDGEMPWGENARVWKERMGYDALYDCAKFYLTHGPASDYLTEMIQLDASTAAERFADDSVRFLFVDASHLYAQVKANLNAWWPKIKSGGFLLGHDWQSGPEVRIAVIEFAGQHGMQVQPISGNCWVMRKP